MTSARTAPPHAESDRTRDHRRDTVRDAVLVNPDWLQNHLNDPAVRVVEVDVSPAAHQQGHIPGAVLWNVYQDLKDVDYRPIDAAAIERLFSRSGIAPESTVVCYGYAPALAFWLLKLYGHREVRILDASRGTWADAGRPWSADVTVPTPTSYPLPVRVADEGIRADHRQVAAAIGDPARALLDVRSGPEFSGERFWPSGGMEQGGRAGHVPTAVNLVTERILDEDGRFRSPEDLRLVFAPAGVPDGAEVITYCTIGGRAATAWFALTYLLGREGVRVYDGSWAEWGRMAAAPVDC